VTGLLGPPRTSESHVSRWTEGVDCRTRSGLPENTDQGTNVDKNLLFPYVLSQAAIPILEQYGIHSAQNLAISRCRRRRFGPRRQGGAMACLRARQQIDDMGMGLIRHPRISVGLAIAEFRYPFALVSTGASAAALSTASTSATSATATKAGIWFRIYDQSIQEQIDRVRHNLDCPY
jgi:hypothetical protein